MHGKDLGENSHTKMLVHPNSAIMQEPTNGHTEKKLYLCKAFEKRD